jgi:hypothetical protein
MVQVFGMYLDSPQIAAGNARGQEMIRGRSAAVLLWHGKGANERDILEPLARRIAIAGVAAIVPDWSTDDGVYGRNYLA